MQLSRLPRSEACQKICIITESHFLGEMFHSSAYRQHTDILLLQIIMTSPSADVLCYEKSIFDAGLHFSRPAFTFQTSQWEPLAKETLSATSWGYIHGNCGSGSTYRNNLTAFSRWSIVPNRL